MVLITGATGLVGSHLALHLVENDERVRAIYRNPENIQKTKLLFSLSKKEALFEKIEWILADITDVPRLEIAFENIDSVYHSAALISFDPKDEELLRKTNIEGTANVVNLCLAFKIKKMLYISSVAALGDLKPNETIITEETEWNPEKPHSDYAITKYGAEMEVWRAQQEGLDVVIVNPGIILGPPIWEEGSGALFAKVKNGLSFYTKGTTGFVAVSDVVQMAHLLMKSNIKNERFTLVAQNIMFRDILFTIADTLQVKRPTIHANKLLMRVLWKIDWVVSTLFRQKRKLSRAAAKASYSKKMFSNEKIKTHLKTEFTDVHQYIRANSALQI